MMISFVQDANQAVTVSLQEKKPLMVYCSKSGEVAGNLTDVSQIINDWFVAVKLVEGTRDYEYFRQMVPGLVTPCVCVVENGVTETIKDMDAAVRRLKEMGETGETKKVQREMNSGESETRDEPVEVSGSFGSFDKEINEVEEEVNQVVQGMSEGKNKVKNKVKNKPQNKASNEDMKTTCVLSFRLLDGSTIKQQFYSNNTLNDVRKWLDTESNVDIIHTDSMPSFASPDALHPTRYGFQSPSIPRVTFDDSQEFSTLEDLKLVPRSVLILKPIFDETVQTAYKNRSLIKSVTSSLGSTVGRFGNALYSFFDYSVNDEDEVQPEPEHKSPTVISINAKTSKPTLINFEDQQPQDDIAKEIDSEVVSVKEESENNSLIDTETRHVVSHPSMTRVQTMKSNDNEVEI